MNSETIKNISKEKYKEFKTFSFEWKLIIFILAIIFFYFLWWVFALGGIAYLIYKYRKNDK
jgi:hypothetical protein